MKSFLKSSVIAALLLSTRELPAAEPGKVNAPAPAEDEQADLAKKLNNPISNLISVPFQNNWDYNIGPAGERSTRSTSNRSSRSQTNNEDDTFGVGWYYLNVSNPQIVTPIGTFQFFRDEQASRPTTILRLLPGCALPPTFRSSVELSNTLLRFCRPLPWLSKRPQP